MDLTQGLAGPVATRLLAEAGADVLKIEPPGGDTARTSTPVGFASWNRSKRSLVIDLSTDGGRKRLSELMTDADVLVHDLTPGIALQFELDDSSLAWRYPQMIVASVNGYPVHHPDAERPADEILIQARIGAMWEQEGHRHGPVFVRMPFASWCAAHLLASGILARLIFKLRCGRAGSIHTSMMQGALVPAALYWHRAQRAPDWFLRRDKIRKIDPVPVLTQFRCSDDKWVQLIGGWAESPPILEVLAELDLVHLLDSDLTRESLGQWAPVFERRTAAEWVSLLSAADVPCVLVREVGDLLLDPQTNLNGYALEVDDPVFGATLQAGIPFQTDPRCEIKWPAPLLGELRADAVWPGERIEQPDGAPQESSLKALLEGVRVVDFGMWVAAPFAAQLLADLGAEVIKVEALSGDRGRGSNQFFGCQRGKRSIAVDLLSEASSVVLERLALWADVAVHNIRPGAARRLGIDESGLRSLNSRLIVGHVSSNGPKVSGKDLPGYDPTAQAAAGWSAAVSGEGNRPTWLRNSVLDPLTGLEMLCGVLLALYHRDRTGHAGSVSASLLGTVALTSSETLVPLPGSTPLRIRPLDSEQTGLSAGYRIYEGSDGWIAIAATSGEEMDRLRQLAVSDDSSDIVRYFRQAPVTELSERLTAAEVKHEIVVSDGMDELFDSAENRELKLVTTYQTPEFGMFEQIGQYWTISDSKTKLQLPVPSLGEHSIAVLDDLGFDNSAIQALLEEGVVHQMELPEDAGLTPR